ncbi:MAG: CoA pyrophosphatase [Bacteroidia bacterium]|nr:CoA pyrophosphatase [Bacteroidia bacterium]
MGTFGKAIEQLKMELGKQLPGKEVQHRMAPSTRKFDINYIKKDGKRRNSSVLILLYPNEAKTNIVFIKRADSKGPHSGQIGFPGGKYETCDLNLIQTALREAEEETGINHKDVVVLGTLTSLFIPVSNISVLPVVGYMNYRPEFVKDNIEVEEILEIELPELADMKNKLVKRINIKNIEIDAPCYLAKDYYIWGATAMILSEFLEVAEKTELVS